MLLVVLALFSVATTAQTVGDCTTFCNDYMTTCVPLGQMWAIYNNSAACIDECMRWQGDAGCQAPFDDGSACSTGNYFGCRRYHLNVAMNTTANPTNPTAHCAHTTPLSSPGPDITAANAISGTVCKTDVNASNGVVPQNGLVADFCNSAINACPSYLSTFSYSRCVAAYQHIGMTTTTTYYADGTSRTFPLAAPPAANTELPCRRYHVQVARSEPDPHCHHALFGAGGCGSDCQTMCTLGRAVCGNELFPASCETECADSVPEAVDYNMINNTDVVCRIYHLTVAAQSVQDATDHCSHGTVESTPDTCGSATTASISALLIAALALITKFSS